MGVIHIDLFTTLDGVAQAPGGPEEDAEGGFAFGGWQAPLIDESIGEQVLAGIVELDALLLGRKTYDIFANYWPHQNDTIGNVFNKVPKYVASRSTPTLEWKGSTLLGPDVVQAVRGLRDRHENIHVSRLCTSCHPEWFYSYRRDGGGTGRMVGFIRSVA